VVRFVSLSPRFQAISLAVAFTATCWVGIASATMVFGNEVIERKDRQIASLREIRGDLHQQLLTLQDDLLSRAQTLQDRQTMIDRLLARSQDAISGNLASRAMAERFPSRMEAADLTAPMPVGGPAASQRTPATVVKPGMEPMTPEQRKKSGKDLPTVLRGDQTSDAGDDPLSEKLSELEGMQDELILRMNDQVATTIDRFEKALKIAGLSSEKVLAKSNRLPEAQGGPYVPLRGTTFENEQQTQALIALIRNVDKLSLLYSIFEQAPLSLPVQDFYISSGFGGRPDPFNGAPAFHSGVDLGSRIKNERIFSTAPGKVSFAGRDGAYGLLVEIDHGNGFSTRYGHLKKIYVRQGQHVALRASVGVMGSTGRSTGTHLHYEVRFNGTPLNPLKIFKAARHVQAI
jgi:murein DD-endopeptidase MepM/ murein hydrolase activator NlpD